MRGSKQTQRLRLSKFWIMLFSGIMLEGCSSTDNQEHERVMDTIEAQMRLPPGAHPIDDYARYYATSHSGKVVAVYTTFSPPHVPANNLKPGERRWLKDYGRLPGVFGGGCDVIHVNFDPGAGTLEQPACNGLLKQKS